jgi:hypothetical protein
LLAAAAEVEAAMKVQVCKQGDCTAHQALLETYYQPLTNSPSIRWTVPLQSWL